MTYDPEAGGSDMPAIAPHNTSVVDTPWDGGAQEAKLKTPITQAVARAMYAWRDAEATDENGDGWPDVKSGYKFPHHEVGADGTPGAANLPGVRNALARLSQADIPDADRDAVRRHLQRHLDAQESSRPDIGIPEGFRDIGGGYATREDFTPPTEDLYRAAPAAPELLLRAEQGELPLMTGHAAVFDEWTEIDSWFEGRFLEKIAPGAFAKTIEENRSGMRVLFQHGRDPQIADKPLGPIELLGEDSVGLAFEVRLLDTSYNRDLIPGLRNGLYGSSFRFQVMREEFVQEPPRSEHNPDGLPERTLREVRLHEFGPVTWPAYASATAGIRGMRSLTDRFRFLEEAQRQNVALERAVSELLEKIDNLAPVQPARAANSKTATAPGVSPTPRPATLSFKRKKDKRWMLP